MTSCDLSLGNVVESRYIFSPKGLSLTLIAAHCVSRNACLSATYSEIESNIAKNILIESKSNDVLSRPTFFKRRSGGSDYTCPKFVLDQWKGLNRKLVMKIGKL